MQNRPAHVAGVRKSHTINLSAITVTIGFSLWMIKPVGDMRLVVIGYGLVLIGSILGGTRSTFWIDKSILKYSLYAIAAGSLASLLGFAKRNPGAGSETVFFVLLPAVWMLIALGVNTSTVRMVVNVMPIAGLVIGIFGVFYWLDATGRGGFSWVYLIDLNQGIGTSSYGYRMRFYPISTLAFLIPFTAMSIGMGNVYTWRLSQLISLPSLLSMLTLLFVSGRRGLLVSLVISLALGLFVVTRRQVAQGVRRRVFTTSGVVAFAAVLLALLTNFSFSALLSSLGAEVSGPDSVRSQSAADLLD